jgi:hypothetical protein
MEVPPGRVERVSDGGPEAVRTVLADLRSARFNGLLKTSVFRGDVPAQGVLVFRDGDGVLAEHRSMEDLEGSPAVPEILRDAASGNDDSSNARRTSIAGNGSSNRSTRGARSARRSSRGSAGS